MHYLNDSTDQCTSFLTDIMEVLEKEPIPIRAARLKALVEKITRIPIVVRFSCMTSFWGYVVYSRPDYDDEQSRGHFAMTLSENLSTRDARYVFCHELAHILNTFTINTSDGIGKEYVILRRRIGYSQPRNRYTDPEEELCDDIALSLLCPEISFRKWMSLHLRLPFQLNLFGEEYSEKYWFFRAVTAFEVPPKELGIYVKQIALGRFIGYRSSRNPMNGDVPSSLKECVSLLKTL